MVGMRYQPQGRVLVNRRNPITSGMAIAITAGRMMNHVSGRLFTPVLSAGYTPPKGAPGGIGWDNAGTNTGFYAPTVASENFANTAEHTILTLVVHTGAIGTPDGTDSHMFFTNGCTPNYAIQYGSGIAASAYSAQAGVMSRWRHANYGGTSGISVANFFTKGKTYCLVSTFRMGVDMALYNDGALVVSSGLTSTQPLDNSSIGSGLTVAFSPGLGAHTVLLACTWNRALSPAEIAAIGNNPWSLFDDGITQDEYEVIQDIAAKVRAALYMNGQGYIMQSPGGLTVKPLVLLNGQLRQRLNTEGIPVILVDGQLRTLASSETLLI